MTLLMVVQSMVLMAALDTCEAPPTTQAILDEASVAWERASTDAAGCADVLTVLQPALAREPQNLFLHVRSLSLSCRNAAAKAAVLAEYQARADKHPEDAQALLLHGVALHQADRWKEARPVLEAALKRDPGVTLAHQQLAEELARGNDADVRQARQHAALFLQACPGSLAAVATVARVMEPARRAAALKTWRTQMQKTTRAADLMAYPSLWTQEFKTLPPARHKDIRVQVGKDLARLRLAWGSPSREQLALLRNGYQQTGDEAGAAWVDAQVEALFPASDQAANQILDRWQREHPAPEVAQDADANAAFHRMRLAATAQWSDRWPTLERVWEARLSELERAPDTRVSDVETATRKLLEAPGGRGPSPYKYLQVAAAYVRARLHLADVPGLVDQCLAAHETTRQILLGRGSQLPPELVVQLERGELDSVYRGSLLTVRALLLMGKTEEARARVSALRARREKEPRPPPTDEATAAAQAERDAVLWQAEAELAAAAGKKLDAIGHLARAAALTSQEDPSDPDAPAKRMEALWKELGGSAEGLASLRAATEAEPATEDEDPGSSWTPQDRKLPELALTDLKGRVWKLADLKGKVVFINVWATWCEPCRREIPFFNQLAEKHRRQKDVVFLSLNTDETAGPVQPLVTQQNIRVPVLLSPDWMSANGFGPMVPQNILVDNRGVVRFLTTGFAEDGNAWVEEASGLIENSHVR